MSIVSGNFSWKDMESTKTSILSDNKLPCSSEILNFIMVTNVALSQSIYYTIDLNSVYSIHDAISYAMVCIITYASTHHVV